MARTSMAVSVLVGATLSIGVLHAEPSPPAVKKSAATTGGTQAARAASVDRAFLDQYCVTCHNEKLKTAGVMFDKLDVSDVAGHAELLEKINRKVKTGQMPPPGRPRPDKAVRDVFVKSLETALDEVAAASPNPGRIAVHRMNRLEYTNTIRDLLSLEIDPALLPADNGGVGFDNNADVLSVTPALMNRYMSAATKVSRLAVGDPTIRPGTQVYKASDFATQTARENEDLPFGSYGGIAVRHAFPLDGEYNFKVRLKRNFYGGTIHGIDREHEVEIRLDGLAVQRYKVGGKYTGADAGILIAVPEDDVEGQKLHDYRLNADKDFNFRLSVRAGTRLITAAFVDDRPAVNEGVPLQAQSLKTFGFEEVTAPGVGRIEISGPDNGRAPEDTASRRRIFVCRPSGERDEEACARRIIGTLARRAYRRPVTDTDVNELMTAYAGGRKEVGFDEGITRALEGLLSMPAFLFRMEQDPAGAKPGQVYRISDLELASRLSFFLWKSIPDDELVDVALRRRLHEPIVLAQQVRRLLADPKATRWMNDFVGQWLTVRNLQGMEPDPNIFPDFDDNLRDAMLKETELFFESQVREDHGLVDLLQVDYTYLNERLARHYGIANVYGGHFRRVPVTDPARQGLLGHASMLTVTSYAHRTSVVLRGKWVLENLLGTPPPPPPPNVPPLKENQRGAKPASLRERMEQHRANPVCAACHARMDPLGFALENFDAIGKWRTDDAGATIDPSSTLDDGTKIKEPKSFRDALLGRGDQFVETVIEKLFAYGLGRSVAYYDQPTIRQLVRAAARSDYRWSSVILNVVNSTPFQMRRVPEARVSPDKTLVQREQ